MTRNDLIRLPVHMICQVRMHWFDLFHLSLNNSFSKFVLETHGAESGVPDSVTSFEKVLKKEYSCEVSLASFDTFCVTLVDALAEVSADSLLALTNLALTDSLPLSSDFFDDSDSAVELLAKSPVPEKLTKMILDFLGLPKKFIRCSYKKYLTRGIYTGANTGCNTRRGSVIIL